MKWIEIYCLPENYFCILPDFIVRQLNDTSFEIIRYYNSEDEIFENLPNVIDLEYDDFTSKIL